jgi:hypothetical protein
MSCDKRIRICSDCGVRAVLSNLDRMSRIEFSQCKDLADSGGALETAPPSSSETGERRLL